MSSLLSSNHIISGLYKSSLLNRTPIQKFYHILNINSTPNNLQNCNGHNITNTFLHNNGWGKTNLLSQISLLSTDNTKKTSTKSQNKIAKSNVKPNVGVKKTDFKNGNDTFAYRQQQQLNQIKHQIQNQQQMQKPSPMPVSRYESVKSKGSTNTTNSINMSSVSTNRTVKNVGKSQIPPSSQTKYSSQKTFNSNHMYNQDIDGKTMFQQQIYNNTSFNNPREVIF